MAAVNDDYFQVPFSVFFHLSDVGHATETSRAALYYRIQNRWAHNGHRGTSQQKAGAKSSGSENFVSALW